MKVRSIEDVAAEEGYWVGVVTAAMLLGFALGIIPTGASVRRIVVSCGLIALGGIAAAAARGHLAAQRRKDDRTPAPPIGPLPPATTATEQLILEVRRIETKDWTAGQIRIWSPPDEHSG